MLALRDGIVQRIYGHKCVLMGTRAGTSARVRPTCARCAGIKLSEAPSKTCVTFPFKFNLF